jgi:transcriptional regulator with XRE-family HTH domain
MRDCALGTRVDPQKMSAAEKDHQPTDGDASSPAQQVIPCGMARREDMIGARLRTLRTERNMSQGDIEERTGLQRCYVSRVENGHTIPSLDTLEKMARALEVPVYKFFYEGDVPPQVPPLQVVKKNGTEEWGFSGKWGQFVGRMRSLLGKMEEHDRQLLLLMAYKMARKR